MGFFVVVNKTENQNRNWIYSKSRGIKKELVVYCITQTHTHTHTQTHTHRHRHTQTHTDTQTHTHTHTHTQFDVKSSNV